MGVGVLFLLVAGPLFAELISTYLPTSGGLLVFLGTLVFLAPLYGGAALVIREVTLRPQLGWRARLLLAASFGVLMPTLVDGALFTADDPDIENWDEIMTTTQVGGISIYAVTAWVVGHMAVSIGAPIAIAEGLVPARRHEPWVSRRVLVTIGVLGIAVALMIRYDVETERANLAESLVSAVVVVALASLAFRLPRRRLRIDRPSRLAQPAAAAATGFALMLAFDLSPINWLGVAMMWMVLAVAIAIVDHAARTTEWSWRSIAALAYGAVLARALVGFLVPVPDDVAPTAKYAQNAVCLVLVILLGMVLRSRMRPTGSPARSRPRTPGRGLPHRRAG